MDYLPVRLGFDELSRGMRIVLLAVTGALLLWLCYSKVLRRFFVSMKDRSLALLVERTYPNFEESLITTVDFADSSDRVEVPVDRSMIQLTRGKAEKEIEHVDPGKLVDAGNLIRSLVIGCLLLLTLAGFAITDFSALKLAAKRLYGLDASLWPRTVRLELVGVRIRNDVAVAGIEELGQVIRPDAMSTFRIPAGASASLLVRARDHDVGIPWRMLPESCLMYFRDADGGAGTQKLNRIGNPVEGWQNYQLTGSPLESVVSPMSFTLRGDDHRIGPYKIEIVDSPTVTNSELDCQFPEYLSQPGVMSWTPRRIPWTGRASLPAGTRFTICGNANKDLEKVYVKDSDAGTMELADVDGARFVVNVDALQDKRSLEFYLVDQDQIVSSDPYVMTIEPVTDEPPDVLTRLRGLGTSVTPNAILPFEGEISDDYQVQKTWVELKAPSKELPPAEESIDSDGKIKAAIDLQELVRAGLELPVDDGSQLSFVVKANDFFALTDSGPNEGVGEKYTFDLVSPDRLLRLLERQEVAQRRRLEQIVGEVSNVKGYLVKTLSRKSDGSEAVGVGDTADPSSQETALRRQALRIVFCNRSEIQITKSSQELIVVANAFDNLRLQLVNNRIDAQDRKQRLEEEVVKPLRAIPPGSITELLATLGELETVLKQIDKGIAGPAEETSAKNLTQTAMQQTDVVLKGIDDVLAKLVKYETQNELLDLVRRMIQEQEAILEKTREKRQKDAFKGLLD